MITGNEIRAACKAIRNISEEAIALRAQMMLVNDAAVFQNQYQSLMVRGMGVALETMAMLLEELKE